MQEEEIVKIVQKSIAETFKDFHQQIKEELEREFHNGERIARFLTRLEERQEILCKNLEELAKSTKKLVETLKKGGKISYAR